MSFISGPAQAKAQEGAAKTAAQAQTAAAQLSTDAMLKMWEKAQQDFAPYLEGGYQGLVGMQQQMPQYMQTVLAPLYQEYMGYNLSQTPDPYAFQVNPITGEVQAPRTAGYDQTPNAWTAPAGTTGQPATAGAIQPYSPAGGDGNGVGIPSASYEVPGGEVRRGMYIGDKWYNADELTPDIVGQNAFVEDPEARARIIDEVLSKMSGPGGKMGEAVERAIRKSIPTQYKLDDSFTQQNIITEPTTTSLPQTQNLFSTSPTTPVNAWTAPATNVATPTTAQLEQGGVLAPTVPEFQRELNFAFDPNDPTYQIREQMKNEEINAWLAKQGLAGSTAGQSFAQKELDKLRAAETENQYNRAARERDYLTQTDIDRYNLLAGRGETLYGRLGAQQDQLYDRAMQNAFTTDERNLALLADRYGMGRDIYGTQYGQLLDLYKGGAGAAGTTGSQSMTTGQVIGQNYQSAGDAAAQAALASGQAQANMWNTIGQTPYNAWAMSQYSKQPNYGGGSGGNYYGASQTPYYSNWEMTGDYIGD